MTILDSKGKPYEDIGFIASSEGFDKTDFAVNLQASRSELETIGAHFLETIRLKKFNTFHERCKGVYDAYKDDSLFRYLVHRCMDFGMTNTRFVAVASKDQKKTIDELRDMAKKSVSRKTEKEQYFWDEFGKIINDSANNVLPGIETIKGWNIKNQLLGGMSTIVYRKGTVTINGETYIVPKVVTTYNGDVTILQRPKTAMPEEKIFVDLSVDREAYNIPLDPLTTKHVYYIPNMNLDVPKSNLIHGFALKYMFSPSDPSSVSYRGTFTVNTVQGLYPDPPFAPLLPKVMIRRQAERSDLSVLDGLINQIIYFHVGNEKIEIQPDQLDSSGNVVKEGTLKRVKEILTAENASNMMRMVLPWYIEIKKMEQNTDVLMSAEKYLQATLEMLRAFGIFVSPPNTRQDFREINRTNFEELLESLILNHTIWLEKLCRKIVEWNRDKLSTVPVIFNMPINTKDTQYLRFLHDLRKLGELSSETLLYFAKLHKSVETINLLSEDTSGERTLRNDNIPIQFSQKVALPNGKEEVSNTTEQGGRPTDSKDKKKRKSKEKI